MSSVFKEPSESALHRAARFAIRAAFSARPGKLIAVGLGFSLAGLISAQAAELDVANGQTDLTQAATYTQNTAPTTTSDVTFTAATTYSPTAFTAPSALSIGTLNDLDATQTLTISGSLITLNGGTNVVAPNPADLLYVATGGTLNISNGISLAAVGNFDIAGTAALSGVLTGNGNGFTKTGAGTLTIAQGNTLSGAININAGTLANSGGGTTITAFGTSAVNLNTGGTLQLTSSATANLVTIGNALTVSGASTVSVNPNGNPVNGNPVFRFNSLALASGAALSITSNGFSSLGATSTLLNGSASITDSNIGSSRGGFYTLTDLSVGNAATTGTVSVLTLNNVNPFSAITGVISDNSVDATKQLSIVKNGTGTLSFNGGGVNTYTGGTTINAGTLTVGTGTLGTGALAVNSATGTTTVNLKTNGATTTGSLSSTITGGGVTISNQGQLFTVNQTTAGTYAGTITGAGGFTLGSSSTSALTLSGNNTFTGNVIVNAGTLNAAYSGNTSDANGRASGSFGNEQTTGKTVTINNSGTVSFTVGNVLGTGSSPVANAPVLSFVVNQGGLLQTAAGPAGGNTGGGDANIFGGITLNGGTLTVGNGYNATFQAAILLKDVTVGGSAASTINTNATNTTANGIMLGDNASGAETITFNVADATGNANADLTVSAKFVNGGGAVGNLAKSGAGTMALTGANTYTGTTTISAGVLQLGNGGTTGSLATGSVITNNGNFTINRSNAVSQGTDFSGAAISGTGSFTQAGAGTTTLNAANTYTGLTSVSAGTLAESANGFIADGSALTVNGATAIFNLGANHSDTVGTVTVDGGGSITGTGTSALTSTGTFEMKNGAVSAILAGTSALNKTTASTVTLSGANTYSGATTVSAGTLAESSTGFIADGSALTVNGATAIFNLGANHSDTVGTVTVDGGGSITGTGTSALTSTGTFEMKNGAVSAILAGTSALNKTTAGTVILSGANTSTGATTISEGTLNASSNGALGATTSVSVNNGGTLLLSGATTPGATPGGVSDRVNNASAITGGGGTIAIGGTGPVLEGTARSTTDGGTTSAASSYASSSSTSVLGLGALTLTSSSTLDFGSSTQGTLVFTSFAPSTFVLNILNYSNTTASGSTISGVDGNDDRLVFSQDQSSNYSSFNFGSGAGVGVSQIALDNGFYEVYGTMAPVPEPSTWIGAGLITGLAGWSQRKRLAGLRRAA